MAKLNSDCPTGAVWFVQEMGSRSIDWNSALKYLRTEESLEDYTKFRHSLMNNFSSLVLSAITENEVPFGWYANYELRTLETYYFIASLRSSRHKRHAAPINEMFQDVLPEWKGFSWPNGSEVHRHNSDLASELHELEHIHSYYAYAKSLSKCDFIKLDSDFEEIFQRLKSENRWPEQSDDFLRALLENHFSLLHELNDNLSVMDVSAGNRLEENRLLEAINKRYAKEFGDTTKNYEELWINKYFVPHMKYKSMVQKRLNQARVLRTEYIPQESHLTTQRRFELKNRALVAKSCILEKLSQMKDRGGGQYRGPGTQCVPGLLLVFASLTAWLALDSRGKEQV